MKYKFQLTPYSIFGAQTTFASGIALAPGTALASGIALASSLAFGVFFTPSLCTPALAEPNTGFAQHVMNMAKDREKVKDMQWNSPTKDSANTGSTSKSWTIQTVTAQDKPFLNSLKWKESKIGKYSLRTGWIFDKWIAATQFAKDGKVVLTEITPPYEYVKLVDPLTGVPKEAPVVIDADKDGKLEIAFLHEKLNDADYHMYTVYRLDDDCPHLIWKSGGELGDWVNGLVASKSAKVRLRTSR
ncbi:MAG: hypothetical protein DKT66_00305 [Candidatus Melainabacteria bacterium]|nr:MAG: hypothetical protein DKT66_00305 [Candidatus Melainabacteria bacterium]